MYTCELMFKNQY